jgi:hypothetical protein
MPRAEVMSAQPPAQCCHPPPTPVIEFPNVHQQLALLPLHSSRCCFLAALLLGHLPLLTAVSPAAAVPSAGGAAVLLSTAAAPGNPAAAA